MTQFIYVGIVRVLFMATHIMWSINLDYLWLGDLPCIVVILPQVHKLNFA